MKCFVCKINEGVIETEDLNTICLECNTWFIGRVKLKEGMPVKESGWFSDEFGNFHNKGGEINKMGAINYTDEVKRLDAFVPGDGAQFWKPVAGQYRVKAVSELEEAQPFQKEGEKPKPQGKIDLLVGDSKYTWTISKGFTVASAYGQLCKLGIKKGKLKDVEFMIVVTNDKKKNTYTIVELM